MEVGIADSVATFISFPRRSLRRYSVSTTKYVLSNFDVRAHQLVSTGQTVVSMTARVVNCYESSATVGNLKLVLLCNQCYCCLCASRLLIYCIH